ncbi:terminal uridylyltransferase 4-like [Hydra vulgaris]|uniref:Terminal uridylyltransferase 4-like n=1 Tax=Hydra vulgaris TaxID=6087 RepID=A0ABM4DJ06_HYDVU
MNNNYEFQLNNLLEQQLLTTECLTKEDLYLRNEVCKQLEECLKKMIVPDLHCQLYGSSLTLLGFKDSNVDIDIKFDIQKIIEFDPLISDPLCFYSLVAEVIQKQRHFYSDLEDNLDMKNPNIKFKDIKSGLSCRIAPFYSKCYHTSDLIIKYINADERCAKLAMLIRMWSKVCNLDNADNGGLSPYCYVIMVINYLQHTKPPVLPIIKVTNFEQEFDKFVDQENEDMYSIPYNEVQCWKSKNTASIAVFFIGFLHYFSVTFHHKSMIVNIRQYAPLLRNLQRYGSRRLVIEDPFISKINVGESLGSQSVMNYLTRCMERTYKYCISFKNRVESHFMKENKELKKKIGKNKFDIGHHDLEEKLDEEQVIHFAINKVLKELLDNVTIEISCVRSFHFHATSFSPKTSFPKFCSLCKSDGHGHTTCENFIVKPLQPLNKAYIDILNQVCVEVMTTCEMTNEEYDFRLKILKRTENHLKLNFHDSCRLSLFGSSINGFGFQNSDLDICLCFETDTPPKDLNYQYTIDLIKEKLRKSSDFFKVYSIKYTKVPIVKFCVRNSNIEGDISLYNCLAIANSKLLKTYGMIDTRVRIMGYCIKYFAKICGIGDASRGSLSSYAYILLMLYYLQHCEPPVIPVLQELAVDKRKTFLIDGKDTWFFDDIQYLDTVWKDYGKNKQTLAELWIGFFNFYVEKFSFKRSVIAIRQKNSLSKFQKSWLHYSMAIEDPFDLDHNLAGSVKGDMFNKILSYFIRARLHFGSPFYGLTKLSMKEYYFDCSRFTDDIVPNDSGKIGKIDSDKNGEQKSLTKDIDLRCFHCDQSGHHKRDCTFQVRLQSQNSNLRNQKSRDYQTNGQEMQITNETKIENLVQTKYKDISINKNANREDGSEKHLNRLYDKSFPVLFSVEQIDSGKNDFLRKQSSAQYALPQQPFNNVSTLSYNSYVVSNPPLNLPPPPLNFIKHQPQLINVLEWKNLFFSSPLYVETFQTYLPNSIILSANDSFLHMQQRPKVGRDKSFEKNKNDQSAAKKSADKKNILQSSDKKSDHPVVAKNDVDIRSGKRYAGNTKSVSNRHDANLGFSNTKSPTNQSNNKNDLSNRNTSINQYNARRDVSNKNGSQNNIKRRV